MEIIVIGTEPPCPRCRETLERIKQAAKEQSGDVSIRKIVYSSTEAKQFGKVGTAYEIAEWAGISMDWEAVKKLAVGDWTPALDEVLMPLKRKAEQESWIMTPAVIVEGEVACFGRVPDREQVRIILHKFCVPERMGATREKDSK